ncbi:hypothetical protein [Clostridium sp. C2-6-12]|uniref:hypothetical protein n=1 Tax=Clostridium sp. C2-6-12 TaxID=2698832 RepID=UPI001367F9E1|nr:hypothetical protein [Clostridium sp. C2-6-12]
MKIDTKPKIICRNPFKHYYFWEHKILNHANLWEGYFDNHNITEASKIVYTGILDNDKNIFHHGFVVYPSIYELLGFLQNVFLPTAFFTWFDRNYDDFYMPLEPYPTVVNEVIEHNKNLDLDLTLINSMNDSYYFLNNLWLFEESILSIALKSFCEKFNNEWDRDYNQKIFLMTFNSPSEVFDFIKTSIGWSDYDEFIEEQISMSLDQLKFTCENAIIEPLLNKKFIEILNTTIPILF